MNQISVKLQHNAEFQYLIGKSKADILELFGFCFNDYISNIWMFRISTKNHLFCNKYLYLFFENDIVLKIELKRCKANYLL